MMDTTPPLINKTSSVGASPHSSVEMEATNFTDHSNAMLHASKGTPKKINQTTIMLPNGKSAETADRSGESSPVSSSLKPIIPGAVRYKYYRVPTGLKELRTKRKVAIVFGYIGEKYCGLQWNHLPNYPTIEEALLKAMFECDLISLENFSSAKVQQLIGFERSSRTDKGVHALRNVVSVNLMLPYSAAYVAAWQRGKAEAIPLGVKNDPNPNDTNAICRNCDEDRKCEGSPDKAEEAGLPSAEPLSPSKEDVDSNVEKKGMETAAKALSDEVENDEDDDDLKYSYDEVKRLLNIALPPDIVVYDVVPVTRSFNAYLCCGGRCYEYYLPTFALMPHELYVSRYFPSSLAPAYPSENDADCTLCFRKYESNNAEKDGEEGGSGELVAPKRRGHFPMRKSKRRRLATLTKEQKSQSKDGEYEGGREDADQEKKEGNSRLPVPPNDVICAEPKEENKEVEDEEEGEAVDASRMVESMMFFRRIPSEMMREVAAKYRLSREHLQVVRELFRRYEGTHPFHYFTPGGRRGDPSCYRFIQQIHVSEPFIVHPKEDRIIESLAAWTPFRFFSPDDGIADAYRERWATAQEKEEEAEEGEEKEKEKEEEEDVELRRVERLRREVFEHICSNYTEAGLEVVRIEIVGQSFMLNQIRKMIGAVIAILAAGLPASFLEEKLLQKRGTQHYGIPMAPANGLLLSSLEFKRYNYRLERIQKGGGNAKNKRRLEVEEVPTEEVSRQRGRTMAVMLRNEMASDIMGKWMRSLRCVLRMVWGIELP